MREQEIVEKFVKYNLSSIPEMMTIDEGKIYGISFDYRNYRWISRKRWIVDDSNRDVFKLGELSRELLKNKEFKNKGIKEKAKQNDGKKIKFPKIYEIIE